jgi:hypothetical protein
VSDQDDSKDDQSFKVNDRRILDASGKPVEPSGKEEKESSHPVQNSADTAPHISFSSFVLSLSTSIMVHLGLAPNPMSNQLEEDVAMAEQEINILEMFKEKTVGNLDEEEKKLIDDVLFHLRMKYVEKKKSLS